MTFKLLTNVVLSLSTPPAVEMADDEGGLVFEKEIVHVGKFTKDEGDQQITYDIKESWLSHWVNTFAEMSEAGVSIAVPVEHTADPEKRRGTVLSMRKGLNDTGLPALFAKIRFRDQEAAKLAKESNVSIYVPRDYPNTKTGKKWQAPIAHVAITDNPVIADLGPFQAIAASLVFSEDQPRDDRGRFGSGGGGSSEPKSMGDRVRDNAGSDTHESVHSVAKSISSGKIKNNPDGSVEVMTSPKALRNNLKDAGYSRVGPRTVSESHNRSQVVTKETWSDGSTNVTLVSREGDGNRGHLGTTINTEPAPKGQKLSLGEMSMTLRDLATQMGVPPEVSDEGAMIAAMSLAFQQLVAKTKPAAPGQQSPGQQPPAPPAQPGAAPAATQDPNKKPFAASEVPEGLAASFSNIVKENREGKIDKLLGSCRITPAVAKDMKTKYCSDEAISLSITGPKGADGFDALVEMFGKNEPVFRTGSHSGAQVAPTAIALSNSLKPENNPMMAAALRRAEKAKA